MNINEFYDTLDGFYSQNQSSKAEKYLLTTLENTRKNLDNGGILLVCNELGGFYRAMGKHTEAEPVYVEALEALKQLNMLGSENHATTLINQATNYAVWGKPKEALDIFKEAEEILKALGFEKDFRLAAMHNNMSILCQDMENYDQASKHLSKALEILSVLEDTEIEVATTYTNLAQIQLQQGHLETALETVEKSLSCFEAAGALTDTHCSAAFETRGHIYFNLGRYEDALESYKSAAELTKAHFEAAHKGYEELVIYMKECNEKLMKGENK